MEHQQHKRGPIMVDTITADTPTANTPPVLMVHGGCHGSWQWSEWLELFAATGQQADALSWRGRGGSDPIDEPLKRSIRHVADDITTAASAYSTAPVLIGHSMGGLASTIYASEHPDNVAALVLLAPVVPSGFDAEPVELPMRDDELWLPPSPTVAQELFWPRNGIADAMRMHSQLVGESPASVREATKFTVPVDVDRISCPVLMVGARQDKLVPINAIERLAGSLDAECHILEEQGHGIPFDPAWFDTASFVLSWLHKNSFGSRIETS